MFPKHQLSFNLPRCSNNHTWFKFRTELGAVVFYVESLWTGFGSIASTITSFLCNPLDGLRSGEENHRCWLQTAMKTAKFDTLLVLLAISKRIVFWIFNKVHLKIEHKARQQMEQHWFKDRSANFQRTLNPMTRAYALRPVNCCWCVDAVFTPELLAKVPQAA